MKKYKINRVLVTVKCDYCGQNHEKPKSEYLRNFNLGRKSYCSRNCFGKDAFYSKMGNKLNRSTEHLKNMRQPANPFKYYIKSAKNRFQECTITLEDLKEQWEIQKGICPYSGINLTLNTHGHTNKDKISSASLDRIDSNLGYIKGNIQWVSQCINYMKNTMTHEETVKVCKLITDFWNKNSL